MPTKPANNLKLTPPPGPTESALRRQWVAWLRWMKLRVLEIGQFHWKVRCPKCQTQFDPDTGYGNDAGAPDAFISAPGWRLDHNGITLSFWVGCEWKRDAKAPVRPEQKELIESGYVEKVFTSAQLEDIVRIGDAFFAFVRERIAEFIPPPAKG